MRAFKLTTTVIVCLAVISYVIVAGFIVSDQGGSEIMLLLVGAVVGVIPVLVYQARVRNERAVILCGTILLLTTVPAWILPMFSDNPFALGYALVFVFPITLIIAVVGASVGRNKSAQSQRPWWNPTG